ncbi:zinc-binding alcohol dehydrogenase family protein [Rubellimicrobium rubrum]|uniref:Zinc-binding alcohol dehydrogenase family protein n=2 Tax=Rubellimicrobium rubrum TaxID=2585369 RepID=A0A5C4MPK1_9RHOB|nr:zinc-binding alcohol dehydrogenase family protein [Rubellimicrobium rubrum]
MLSGTCVQPGEFALLEHELPQVAPPGHVLIDIAAVGICGTDYHILEGKHPFLAYPRVIGHELSATVAETAEGWTKGQLVVVNPYIACGTCRACRRGKPNCCQKIEVLGVHRDGGLCARIVVPAGNLYAAEGLTPIQAAMVEFLAIGAHAVRRSGTEAGDRVLVTGVGPIGLGTALFARLAGAEVHILDVSPERLDLAATRFGFERTHVVGQPVTQGDLADGFDAVFDATGNARAIEAGFPLVAHGGSYVLVSVVRDTITFEDPEFHKREMRLIGSRNALKEDFDQVMETLRSGAVDSEALCSEIMNLEQFQHRFEALASDRTRLIKAVVRF